MALFSAGKKEGNRRGIFMKNIENIKRKIVATINMVERRIG